MFNSKFLASPKKTATCIIDPSTRRQSKMFQRRAAHCCQALHADEIIMVAPAINDINVVEVEPELAFEEITTASPAIVAATHIEGTPEVVQPESDMEPGHADRNTVILCSAENAVRCKLPQNDVLLQPDKIAPEMIPDFKASVAAPTVFATVPVPLVPSGDGHNAATSAITSATPADTRPVEVTPSPATGIKKHRKSAEIDGLGSPRQKRSSRSASGKKKGLAEDG